VTIEADIIRQKFAQNNGGLVLGTIGRRVLEKAFENSVKAIEARKDAARAAGAS
jgi:hypothetical protein